MADDPLITSCATCDEPILKHIAGWVHIDRGIDRKHEAAPPARCSRCHRRCDWHREPGDISEIYIHTIGVVGLEPITLCDPCFQWAYEQGLIEDPYLTAEQYQERYRRGG